MRISGTEPSSVILSQNKVIIKFKVHFGMLSNIAT